MKDNKQESPGAGLVLAGVLLVGLALRLYVAAAVICISNDGSAIVRHAIDVAGGDLEAALDHPQHPLTTLLVALPIRLGASALPAALALMVAASFLTLLPVWRLATDIGGARVGLVAVAYAAAFGPWLEQTATVLTEPVYVLCLATCAAMGWRAVRDGSVAAHVAFGISGALAFLTRPEGIVLPAIASLFLLERLLRDGDHRRKRLIGCLAGAMAAVVLIGPYVAYLSDREGRFVASAKHLRRAGPPPTPAEQRAIDRLVEAGAPTSEPQSDSGLDVARFVDDLQKSIFGAYSIPMGALILLLLLAGGVSHAWRRAPPPGGWLAHCYLGACLAAYLAVFAWRLHSAGYVSSRHVASTAILVLPWAALATVGAGRWLGGGKPWREVLVSGALLVTIIAFQLHDGLKPHGSDKQQIIDAAAWLREHEELASDSVVMGNLPRIAFYAGARGELPPDHEGWYLEDEWREILEERLGGDGAPAYVAVDREAFPLYASGLVTGDHAGYTIEPLVEIDARKERDDVLLFRVRRR